MIKSKELATHESCLNRAHDDEPIFVLRANDPIAPALVNRWSQLYLERKRHSDQRVTPEQQAKAGEANQLAWEMKKWRRENRG